MKKIHWRHLVLLLFIVILTGCSSLPAPVKKSTPPLYYTQSETWQSIDEQLLNTSISARKKARAYAREAMENWLWRVRQRTEDVFIPWYSSYWTQQWMASRVAWYTMHYSEGELTPKERLTYYLQQQFYEQVLEPISIYIEPGEIMEETTAQYLRAVKNCVEQFPHQFQIPRSDLNQHLKFIPAIVMPTYPSQDASLYDILQLTDLSALPAYKSLLAQIEATNGITQPGASKAHLNSTADKAVTKLVEQLEVRGVSSIASLIVGGHWGLFITVGTATWTAAEHEDNKTAMEAQLRDILNSMLEDMWHALFKDTRGGVTSAVHHMSRNIEYSLFKLDSSGSGLF
jgi:hypothetical protein